MALFCGMAYTAQIVSSEAWALYNVGTGPAFMPVVKLASGGVFAYRYERGRTGAGTMTRSGATIIEQR